MASSSDRVRPLAGPRPPPDAAGLPDRAGPPDHAGLPDVPGLPDVVALDDPRAADPRVAGSKAAALAVAATHGLPTVPGFVVTTAAVERLAGARDLPAAVVQAWRALSRDGAVPLVVRSSSCVEDLGDSSMAGRFTSVVGVRGRREFDHAVATVVASRAVAAQGASGLRGDEPIAVLVQTLVDARSGGVLFGLDPVTGREDRLVVAAVEGVPDRLVSGEVDGSRYVLTRSGRCEEQQHGAGGVRLDRRRLRSLARLAARTAEVFGGPQDVEWAVDDAGRLRLLQSRPVTAHGRGTPQGPVLGPGPVVETFPDPLQPLEVEIWVDPLREGLRHALALAGGARPGALARSPLVAVVGGRVAVDLDLLAVDAGRATVRQWVDPRPAVRRLRASWRVGRLHAALPALALDVLARADAAMSDVPPLGRLSDAQLVGLVHRTAPALSSVHAHEVLVGLLVDPAAPATTGVGAALRVLATARQDGRSDDEVLAASAVVLALLPPRVGPPRPLPAGVRAPVGPPSPAPLRADDPAVLREALRLRVRWLQELGARAVWELAGRWVAAGRLADREGVRGLRLADLEAAVRDPSRPLVPRPTAPGDELPVRFRLTDRGLVVVLPGAGRATGAGGGRGTGVVHQGGAPPDGAVLVVRTLDPALAPVLPRLAGLVAETGSVLAHLAILAREQGVPTVVGVAGAVQDLPPGTVVTVDGGTGRVERLAAP